MTVQNAERLEFRLGLWYAAASASSHAEKPLSRHSRYTCICQIMPQFLLVHGDAAGENASPRSDAEPAPSEPLTWRTPLFKITLYSVSKAHGRIPRGFLLSQLRNHHQRV